MRGQPGSPALKMDSLPSEPPGKPHIYVYVSIYVWVYILYIYT